MPEISRFFGMVITMNYHDHNPPHFHVEYQGFKAICDIKMTRIIKGKLPPTADKIIVKWAEQYKKELLESWEMAVTGRQPKRIPEAR